MCVTFVIQSFQLTNSCDYTPECIIKRILEKCVSNRLYMLNLMTNLLQLEPKENGKTADDRMDSEEAEADNIECPVCFKIIEKKYEADHMKFHEDFDHLTCLVCNRKFDSLTSLDMHKNGMF